jgi:hypothetical protein
MQRPQLEAMLQNAREQREKLPLLQSLRLQVIEKALEKALENHPTTT